MSDKERVAMDESRWKSVGDEDDKTHCCAHDMGFEAGVAFCAKGMTDWLLSDSGCDWVEKCLRLDCTDRSNAEALVFVLAKRFLIGDWKR